MEATVVKSFDKYYKSDKVYHALLNRLIFHGSRLDFWALYFEAESQNKKLYLLKDRYKEYLVEDPTIDWEQIILPEDVSMR
jgi:hypothetical protein